MSSSNIAILKSRLTPILRPSNTTMSIYAIAVIIFVFVSFPQVTISYLANLTQLAIDQFGLGLLLISSFMVLLVRAIVKCGV